MVAYIGIDLGTSACCVASYCDGEAQVILNEAESPTTPSYVAFSGNQRLIGSAALEQVWSLKWFFLFSQFSSIDIFIVECSDPLRVLCI